MSLLGVGQKYPYCNNT